MKSIFVYILAVAILAIVINGTSNGKWEEVKELKVYRHVSSGASSSSPLSESFSRLAIHGNDANEDSIQFGNINWQQGESSNSGTNFDDPNNIVALDCEFVGGGGGRDILARVSIVDGTQKCIYDKYVRPVGYVFDYRTKVSGILPSHFRDGKHAVVDYGQAQKDVEALIAGKIVVGHQLDSDFKVLKINHPLEMRRDTATFMPFRTELGIRRTPSLKDLAKHFLDKDIQQGAHNSIEDAQIPMEIYLLKRAEWEEELLARRGMNGGREWGKVVDDGKNKGKTVVDYDGGKFHYYSIMARYEMVERKLRKNREAIMREYELDEEKMGEMLAFYQTTKDQLNAGILPEMETQKYVDKFRAFSNLLYAYEEIEAANNYEDNITGRRIPRMDYRNKKGKYMAYEFTVKKWSEDYRRRAEVVVGEAIGNIVKVEKKDRRFVALFDQENEAKIRTNQRMYVMNNDAAYGVVQATIEKIKKNDGRLRTAIFPTIENLPPLSAFLRERREEWTEFGAKFDDKNEEQSKAIYSIVSGAHGNVPFILWGPPGTGKTVTIVEAIGQLLQKDRRNRVLICTQANMAADLVAKRILALGIVGPSELRRFYSLGKDVDDMDRELRDVVCIQQGGYMGTTFQQFTICNPQHIRVAVMTLAASAALEEHGVGPDFFSHIFIDEAAQSLELETLIPIVRYANGRTTRIILAGDHQQLGPVVMADFLKKNFSTSDSLLNRLMSGPHKQMAYNNDERTSVKLVRNYRSHEHILKFPSDAYYDGQLIAANSARRSTFANWAHLPRKGFPIIFHIVEGGFEQQIEGSASFWNEAEVEMVQAYIKALLPDRRRDGGGQGLPDNLTKEQIGVISPYKLQTVKVREALGNENRQITVDSVERFQGSDRRVIIMTLARSKTIGFLKKAKRINTSLTRAEELLIIVISRPLLNIIRRLGGDWAEFYNYCAINGAVVGNWHGQMHQYGPQHHHRQQSFGQGLSHGDFNYFQQPHQNRGISSPSSSNLHIPTKRNDKKGRGGGGRNIYGGNL